MNGKLPTEFWNFPETARIQLRCYIKTEKIIYVHSLEKMKIFDIYATQREKLEFQLPYYKFNHGDKIAIKKIIIDWKTAPNKVFGIITTDLVSGFSENRRHQVCSFVKPSKTTTTEVNYSHPIFYQVNQPFLQDSRFSIESMFEDKIPEIKNAYIQLISQ